MIRQVQEFAQKALILAGAAIAGGAVGFYVPLFVVAHDVSAAMSATLFGVVGVVVGLLIGWFIIRRNFD